jgi:hypothetical protein
MHPCIINERERDGQGENDERICSIVEKEAKSGSLA